MLQATNVLQPDGTTVTSEYYPTGQLKRQYGSRTYPVGYGYDYAGRVLTMTNWTAFPATGTRVTTWNYNPSRGWLDSKTYDGGVAGPSYLYKPSGRLMSRTWARNITTTYTYDNAGGLATVGYSDGTTPGVSYTYDRRGRPATVIQNGIQDTLAYNDANMLLSEAYSGGLLAGVSVTSGYDQYLRRSSLVLNNQQSTLQSINFGYDNASRLQTVTDNTTNTAYSATYNYLANSPLVSQITFKQSSTTQMTTTKQWDYLNRLASISSLPSLASLSSFAYTYNNANQRTRTALTDNSYWLFNYDALGQVTTGQKYWSDQTPVAGQQLDYAFDNIGNRLSTKAGGDQNGANQRTANYNANSLNEYTNRDVPGAVDIVGVGLATNAVTVNGTTAYRKGEYFRQQVSVSNGNNPVWQTMSVAESGQTSVSGNLFVPKNQEQFSYDLDGNLTGDGRWTYGWDAENRLTSLTPSTSVGPQISLKFEYDWQGRRIHKQVWDHSNWGGSITNDVKFVYDGWNLIAILNSSFNLQNSFMWGLDLSGSLQGAGGVGGLLAIRDITNGVHFAAYDGNGNISAFVNAANGAVSAQYEYGPFGEVLRATGPMAKANPFRFSTKYQDDETDLLYYGYRYYNASTGRWLNRDPKEEQGGANLYCQSFNDLINNIDLFGLDVGTVTVIRSQPVKRFEYRGWDIELRWTPPSEWKTKTFLCLPCREVVWIQDYYSHKVSWPFGNETTVGPKKDWDESDYVGSSGEWNPNLMLTRYNYVDMWDKPSIWPVHNLTSYRFSARSRVKCVQGPDSGLIYATVYWGWIYNRSMSPDLIGGVVGFTPGWNVYGPFDSTTAQ